MSRDPLTSEKAWEAMWVRQRSGPRPRQQRPAVSVGRWHRVRGVDHHFGGDRFVTTCNRYGSTTFFPSGGLRLEVAAPTEADTLPGDICAHCLAGSREPLLPEPEESDDADRIGRAFFEAMDEAPDDVIDRLARRVARRLVDRADETRPSR